MSPEALLGPALADAVRDLVREELQRVAAPASPPLSPWRTPPAAASYLGVPVKAVRALVVAGRVTARLRNANAEPKQKKYLVNVNEVAVALEVHGAAAVEAPGRPSSPAAPIDLEQRAAQIRARAAARR